MTIVEWLAFFVLLICGLTAGAAVTLSNGAVTKGIQRLEQTYRRQKGLELEQLQAQAIAQRQTELVSLLAGPTGWRQVLDQLLADALPETGASVGQEGLLDLHISPAPRFTVAGKNGRLYLFTISPEMLGKVGVIGRKDHSVPVDATLHPAARVEVQMVWEQLASQRLRGTVPALPRQAPWFLVVREGGPQ